MQHHEAHVPTLHAALTLERPVSSRRPPPTRQRQAGPRLWPTVCACRLCKPDTTSCLISVLFQTI